MSFKARSEAILAELGGPVDPALPELSPRRELRSLEAIFGRAFALYAMQFSLYIASAPILEWLEKNDLLIHVSPEERRLLALEGYDHQTEHVLSWANESLWAFLWMLGLVGELDFRWRAYDSIPPDLPNLVEEESLEPVRARARLRPRDEIFAQLDLYYRLGRWTRNELDAGGWCETVNYEVVMERLRAFDWAFSLEDWDDVDVRNRG